MALVDIGLALVDAGFLSTSYRCLNHFLRVSVVSHAVPDRHFVLVFGRGFCECQQQKSVEMAMSSDHVCVSTCSLFWSRGE